MIEFLAYQRRANLPLERAMPLVFKAISVDVERCFDLTAAAEIADIALTVYQIRTEPWWLARARGEESLTQALGRAAHACGIQSLLAGSAHSLDQGVHVIVLSDHLQPPCRVAVLRRPMK